MEARRTCRRPPRAAAPPSNTSFSASRRPRQSGRRRGRRRRSRRGCRRHAMPAAAESGLALKVPGWPIFSCPPPWRRRRNPAGRECPSAPPPPRPAARRRRSSPTSTGPAGCRTASCAPPGDDAEAGDHLVENQQNAVLGRSAGAAPCRNSGSSGTWPNMAPVGSRIDARRCRRLLPGSAPGQPRVAGRHQQHVAGDRSPARRASASRRNGWCSRWSCGRASRGNGP